MDDPTPSTSAAVPSAQHVHMGELGGTAAGAAVNGNGQETVKQEQHEGDDNQSVEMDLEEDPQVDKKPVSSQLSDPSHSQPPPVKPEPDPDQFLKFEMEEDKKVKLEQQEANSRSNSNTPGAKDEEIEDEEDLKPKRKPGQPVSIAHLPLAEKEAMSAFEELEFSWYQNKSIGQTHQQEDSMQCDCRYDPETDDLDAACGPHSGCINRLTQIECVGGDCRCKGYCQNQRFQKRQFAPIEIVQTEKKGFGMRAREDIERDEFIYEYVGDIIGEKKFQQRMKAYFDEGIRHFYFMSLQKEEFIDATKRGGKGRFLNHSCAPNCYVAKWVVGRKLRMGIFAKRNIEANEELTFNYNVDRYGHEAQECYCGEPNCVGYIGGKTQTDIAGMDDLYLDALGITDAVEALQLKGTKKRKSKKLNEDFNPTLTQITLEDVPKVSSAVRQATNNRVILSKLLSRILLTEDQQVQRQIMRLHGFSMMSMVMHEFSGDNEITVSVLGVLAKWPLITRNKIQSTNMESLVQKLAESEEETVSDPAKQLLEMWQALEIGYRIPKAIKEAIDQGDEGKKRKSEFAMEAFERKRAKFAEDFAAETARPIFVRPEVVSTPYIPPAPVQHHRPPPQNWCLIANPPTEDDPSPPPSYMCMLTKAVYPEFPPPDIVAFEAERFRQANTIDVNEIIARARAEAEEKAATEAANAAAHAAAEEAAKKAKRQHKEGQSKEKKMYRLFSTLVVAAMSKYKKHLEGDQFKRRAKEVCDIMCEKEKKGSGFQTETYDSLSPEKETKIKKYVKEFITKLLARKGIKVSSSSSSASKSSKEHSSSSKDRHHHHSSSSHHKSRPSSHSAPLATPGKPSTTTPTSEAQEEDMDIEQSDDDLINSLVEDATGGSETPESAKTPQNAPSGTLTNGKAVYT